MTWDGNPAKKLGQNEQRKEFWDWAIGRVRIPSSAKQIFRHPNTPHPSTFSLPTMAFSVSASASASASASFYSERSSRFAPSAASSANQFSLQFPSRTRLLPIINPRAPASSRPRFLPLVQAKKQTYNSFDDLLANSEKPVLVDFYATWCGPCQFMVPILNEVSTRLRDKIQVVKIDTEKYPSIADKYRIEALPTFIMFKDGEPYDRFEGALTADQLIERIEAGFQVKQ
ncbi:hypothetical protein VNO78_19662 [Psophocarpus tetragonolobus]|uniref:Thioredoxin domain-containing protein n=1 Tax=Psophocarpus tetragonolobus TaxID=3891 RepID=A0AAN9S7X4_PSOTE